MLMKTMFCYDWLVGIAFVFRLVHSVTIEVPGCPQPNYPLHGGYVPKKTHYTAGDKITYYCDIDSIFDGNYTRTCSDNGDWTLKTPFCDPPMRFTSVEQSSTMSPEEDNQAELATDGLKTTCTSTQPGNGSYWLGHFKKASWMVRVAVFMPLGPKAFSVALVRENGYEGLCGPIRQYNKDLLGWVVQTCTNPNNSNIVAVKVSSLTDQPIELCEIAIHSVIGPYCSPPETLVENGHLVITRQKADVVCNNGFHQSDEASLRCLRNFVWTRKTLFCIGSDIEIFPRLSEKTEMDDEEDKRQREKARKRKLRNEERSRQRERGKGWVNVFEP